MKITKFGHCCLLIEERGARILTDPGTYSDQQDSVMDIDIVLITHEHADHFHIESLKKLLSNNQTAIVITNSAVGQLLTKENIAFQLLEQGDSNIKDILFEAFGEKHAIMHPSVEPVQNTGYMINNRLFYPGDALTNPNKPLEILALPVAGPWIKLSEAIDYALELKPTNCFPVHDGGLKSPGVVHKLPGTILNSKGIKFVVIEPDQTKEF